MPDSDSVNSFSFPPGSEHDPFTMQLLGWHLISLDKEAGVIRVGYESQPNFRNPRGVIQGGMLAAMIDDTFGPLIILTSDGCNGMLTLDLNVSYLAPGKPGHFECEARIIRKGRTIGFLEAELFGGDGELVARSTSTCRIVPMPPPVNTG
ncbi:MAG: PaaI family thioesterase [Oceanicoccus sp.]